MIDQDEKCTPRRKENIILNLKRSQRASFGPMKWGYFPMRFKRVNCYWIRNCSMDICSNWELFFRGFFPAIGQRVRSRSRLPVCRLTNKLAVTAERLLFLYSFYFSLLFNFRPISPLFYATHFGTWRVLLADIFIINLDVTEIFGENYDGYKKKSWGYSPSTRTAFLKWGKQLLLTQIDSRR